MPVHRTRNIPLFCALRILCRWLHSNTLPSVAPGAVMAIAVEYAEGPLFGQSIVCTCTHRERFLVFVMQAPVISWLAFLLLHIFGGFGQPQQSLLKHLEKKRRQS